jgi:hypothetical protein
MTTGLVDPPLMTKRNDVSVKMDAEVIAEAKMVAASRNVTLAEYLTELVRDLVHQDLEDEMTRRVPRSKRKPKGGES